MKHFYLLIMASIMSLASFSQINVTSTVGAPAAYTTLGDAFLAINFGTHQGVIVITISANTLEVGSCVLNASGAGAANYLLIDINCTSLATITGAVAGPLVSLNGADSVSINGNSLLTINNTSTAGNALTFTNDAQRNKVKNTYIKGGTSATASGVVAFLTAASALGSSGNDRNLIEGCSIDGSGTAVTCIYSAGTASPNSPDSSNSGDTIRNCNIFDNFTITTSPIAINLSANNTGWVITGNSVYQKVNRSTAFQAPFTGIQIFPNWTSDNHIVSNNFIGGTGPNATGLYTFSGSGTNAVGFTGMSIQTGGPGNLIANNTIQNVTCTYGAAAGSFANAGIFVFIGGYNGETEVRENIINNITITNTAGSALGSGITANGRTVAAGLLVFPQFFLTKNTLSNISYNAGGTGAVQFIGIRLETSSSASATITPTALSNPLFYVDSNNVVNISTPFTSTNTFIRGIQNVNTQGTGATARLYPLIGLIDNSINGISTNSTLSGFGSPAASGIFLSGSITVAGPPNNTTDMHVLLRNTINNISNNSTADAGTGGVGVMTAGIVVSGGGYMVNSNKIYDLRNSAPGLLNNAGVMGISVRALFDTTTVVNNFVTLGNGLTGNISFYGIINNLTSTSTLLNVFHNSVVIEGTGGAGNTRGSVALSRDTATALPITTSSDFRNNLLINRRTGGTGSHFALVVNENPAITLNSNYNDIYTISPATNVQYGGAPMTLAAYQAASGKDANSNSLDVTFANSATGDLHLAGPSIGNMALAGQPLILPTQPVVQVAVNNDYDVQARPAINPYKGADEANTPLPTQLTSFTAFRDGLVNVLNWTTAQEINTRKFIIERSQNGREFEPIGEESAAGNSATSRDYKFIDANPAKGINYYRIKTVDFDNSGKYSIVRSVKNNGKSLISVYPNPAKETTNLSIDADKAEKATLTIVDMSGVEMHRRSIQLSEGSNTFQIDLGNFAGGVYVIRVKLSEGEFVHQINKL